MTILRLHLLAWRIKPTLAARLDAREPRPPKPGDPLVVSMARCGYQVLKWERDFYFDVLAGTKMVGVHRFTEPSSAMRYKLGHQGTGFISASLLALLIDTYLIRASGW